MVYLLCKRSLIIKNNRRTQNPYSTYQLNDLDDWEPPHTLQHLKSQWRIYPLMASFVWFDMSAWSWQITVWNPKHTKRTIYGLSFDLIRYSTKDGMIPTAALLKTQLACLCAWCDFLLYLHFPGFSCSLSHCILSFSCLVSSPLWSINSPLNLIQENLPTLLYPPVTHKSHKVQKLNIQLNTIMGVFLLHIVHHLLCRAWCFLSFGFLYWFQLRLSLECI